MAVRLGYREFHVFLLVSCLAYMNEFGLETVSSVSSPSLVEFIPDNRTQSLFTKWQVRRNGQGERDLAFEIQVGRTSNYDIVYKTNISVLEPTNDELTWTWVSQLPLECTDHSIRIRRIVNNTFASVWSPWKTNFGLSEPIGQAWVEPKWFPIDRVLQEGSSGHFCCIPPRGKHIASIIFNNTKYPMLSLGEGVKAIVVDNLNITLATGVYFLCNDSEEYGGINFVTFPPQKPRNLSCKTQDMRIVNCMWSPGRLPNLYKSYRRKYTLLIQNTSADAIPCSDSSCSFNVTPGRQVYNITVKVKNDLGEEWESFAFSITDHVFPAPKQVSVTSGGNVSWTLPGNFTGFRLVCQIRTPPENLSMVFEQHGLVDGHYEGRVEGLLPCSEYTAMVCCSTAKTLKTWGECAESSRFTTPPSRLYVWRRLKPLANNYSVTILWNAEPCTLIQGYTLIYQETQLNIKGDQNEKELIVGPNTLQISISAYNQGGSSPQSHLTINPVESRDSPLNAKRLNGSVAVGFTLFWSADAFVTCGYIVEWCVPIKGPTCRLQWKSVPVESTSLCLPAGDFRAGQRYTFNIFSCEEAGYHLLGIQTGYIEEQKPTESPYLLTPKTTHSSITLWWNFSEDDYMHPGFISAYVVTVQKIPGQESHNILVNDPHTKNITISSLLEDTEYSFLVSARTAAGLGPPAKCKLRTPLNYYLVLAKVLAPILLLLLLGTLVWFHRNRLKVCILEVFCGLVELKIRELELDSSLYEASEKIHSLKAEECSCSLLDIVEVGVAEKGQTQSDMLPYCPQASAGALENPPSYRVTSLTNLTYCSTVVAQPRPNGGPLDYVPTTAIPH